MTDDRIHQDLERLAAIVSSSDDAIISKTLEGVISTWNKGAENIFGYSAEEMIGQPIHRIIPPELHDEEADILARLRRGERIEHFDTVRLAKDGRRVELSLTVSPLRDRQGVIYGASKVARDIGERRRSEELQQTLFDELNHRVKNTLALVQAIATQSLRSSPDPSDFVSSFSGRIKALAQSHDLLVREQLAGVNLRELVSQQVVLSEDDRERALLRGPNLVVGGTAGTHLGLIVHELATNARKHGALSSATGTVLIDWELECTDGLPNLCLNWHEKGAPAHPPTSREGFGTTLLRRVADASGGSVEIQDDGSARQIVLKLPLQMYRLTAPPATLSTRDDAAISGEVPSLRGCRVLVVEDEFIVALDEAAVLEEEGCLVLGPAATVDQAIVHIASTHLDLAVLDANLNGRSVERIAEALAAKGVPFLFASGYGPESLPRGWGTHPLLEKPFSGPQLIKALLDLAALSSSAPRAGARRKET